MEIKEENAQRMVIGSTTGLQVFSLLGGGFFIIFGSIILCGLIDLAYALGLDIYWNTLIGWCFIGVGLLAVVGAIPEKIVIHKLTQTITLRKQRFLFIPWRRVIPFSSVMSVDIAHKKEKKSQSVTLGAFGTYSTSYLQDEWRVSLNIDDLEQVEIEQSEYKERMSRLAEQLREFIGTEEIGRREELARPKELARKEAVASFKQRMEQDAGERKKQKH